jgi:hypothetical protein
VVAISEEEKEEKEKNIKRPVSENCFFPTRRCLSAVGFGAPKLARFAWDEKNVFGSKTTQLRSGFARSGKELCLKRLPRGFFHCQRAILNFTPGPQG